MNQELTFKVVSFSSTRIESGEGTPLTLPVFTDDAEAVNEVVSQQRESAIVQWLFSHVIVRGLIFEQLGFLGDPLFKLNVVQPVIQNPNKRPGDVDTLICERGMPQQATAMEWKRVKVAADVGGDRLNKVEGIEKGVFQANALRKLGFYKTYLAVLVAVDGTG